MSSNSNSSSSKNSSSIDYNANSNIVKGKDGRKKMSTAVKKAIQKISDLQLRRQARRAGIPRIAQNCNDYRRELIVKDIKTILENAEAIAKKKDDKVITTEHVMDAAKLFIGI